MQKADVNLSTGIRDENKHNILFFCYENTLLCLPYAFTLMVHYSFLNNLLDAYPLKYYLLLYEVSKYPPYKHVLHIKTHTMSYPI